MAKLKTFLVRWQDTIEYETEVQAKTEKQAIEQVKNECYHDTEYEVEHYGECDYSAEIVSSDDDE